jgi:predicted RNA-binding protein with PUA-like domain
MRKSMAHWLLKTEPDDYSFDNLLKDRKTIWDGVNNNLALKYLRQIKKGDQLLIYHTGSEKAVIGIAVAAGDAYSDPNGNSPRQAVIDIQPVSPLPRPVTLAAIKADEHFAGWELLRIGRLSVMPVSLEHWKRVLAMGGKS